MKWPIRIQYACAVLLIVSSIILAFYQVLDIDDIANGTLMYTTRCWTSTTLPTAR